MWSRRVSYLVGRRLVFPGGSTSRVGQCVPRNTYRELSTTDRTLQEMPKREPFVSGRAIRQAEITREKDENERAEEEGIDTEARKYSLFGVDRESKANKSVDLNASRQIYQLLFKFLLFS